MPASEAARPRPGHGISPDVPARARRRCSRGAPRPRLTSCRDPPHPAGTLLRKLRVAWRPIVSAQRGAQLYAFALPSCATGAASSCAMWHSFRQISTTSTADPANANQNGAVPPPLGQQAPDAGADHQPVEHPDHVHHTHPPLERRGHRALTHGDRRRAPDEHVRAEHEEERHREPRVPGERERQVRERLDGQTDPHEVAQAHPPPDPAVRRGPDEPTGQQAKHQRREPLQVAARATRASSVNEATSSGPAASAMPSPRLLVHEDAPNASAHRRPPPTDPRTVPARGGRLRPGSAEGRGQRASPATTPRRSPAVESAWVASSSTSWLWSR